MRPSVNALKIAFGVICRSIGGRRRGRLILGVTVRARALEDGGAVGEPLLRQRGRGERDENPVMSPAFTNMNPPDSRATDRRYRLTSH